MVQIPLEYGWKDQILPSPWTTFASPVSIGKQNGCVGKQWMVEASRMGSLINDYRHPSLPASLPLSLSSRSKEPHLILSVTPLSPFSRPCVVPSSFLTFHNNAFFQTRIFNLGQTVYVPEGRRGREVRGTIRGIGSNMDDSERKSVMHCDTTKI